MHWLLAPCLSPSLCGCNFGAIPSQGRALVRLRAGRVIRMRDGTDAHHGASLRVSRQRLFRVVMLSAVCLVGRDDAMRAKDLRCLRYAQKRTSGLAFSRSALCQTRMSLSGKRYVPDSGRRT